MKAALAVFVAATFASALLAQETPKPKKSPKPQSLAPELKPLAWMVGEYGKKGERIEKALRFQGSYELLLPIRVAISKQGQALKINYEYRYRFSSMFPYAGEEITEVVSWDKKRKQLVLKAYALPPYDLVLKKKKPGHWVGEGKTPQGEKVKVEFIRTAAGMRRIGFPGPQKSSGRTLSVSLARRKAD